MSWKRMRAPETRLATAALVSEFVKMEPAPGDRPLSERRLQVYERILTAGEFRPVTWASAVCHETNCTYRVNGKHTSTLLSLRNPLPDFYVTVERYVCDRLSDVADLYNTFDSRLGARTTGDINAAFAATIPQLASVPARFVNYTVTAAAFLAEQGGGAKERTPAERAELLLDCHPFATWLHALIPSRGQGANSTAHLVRQPVVNAMMATWDRLPNKSREFWELVRDESHGDRDHCTRLLGRWLVRVTLGGRHHMAKAKGEAVSGREMYVKCLRAWNSWRTGEPTKLQYRDKDPLPEVSK